MDNSGRDTGRRGIGILVSTTVAAAGFAFGIIPAQAQRKACPAPAPMTFAKQQIIDETRAGGEPTVITGPDGALLYGAHAGTTHFYTPSAADPTTAAFVQNYRNQTYYYYSEDNGKTWEFSDRTIPPSGVPGSGFSDPDFAVDKADQVYVSEINLANVAVSKSTDGGRTYELQNFFGMTMTDRQWMEADQKDVLYIVGNAFAGGTFPNQPAGNVGHYLYKSTDGGQTFSEGIADQGGLGDIKVDKRDGTLYEAHLSSGNLSMVAFRKARKDNFDPDENTIAEGVSMLSHWPSLDIDAQGNLYIVWDESGRGSRPAGVWYSYSKNRGKSWAEPTRVDTNNKTDIWPWLAVGDKGRVAIVWFEADKSLPEHDAETQGDHGWRVRAAQSLNALGCGRSDEPGFTVVTATPDPIHKGTVCQGGTLCQAFAIDRRLGDYFSVAVDRSGRMWAAYSDTSEGGAVALPGLVRQSGGPSFRKKGSIRVIGCGGRTASSEASLSCSKR